MKTPAQFLVFSLLLAITPLAGQDCNDLENWGQLLEAEFPDVNMGGVRSGSPQSNRMLFNLYSDKYFVPVSGQPFDQLSARERTAKGTKLRRCERKKTSLQSGTKLWMNYFGTSPLGNDREAEAVIRGIIEIRALRQRYKVIMDDLLAGNMEYNEVQRLKVVANREFGPLMPSEIKALVTALDKVGTEIADKTLLAKARSLQEELSTPMLVNRLVNFGNANAIAYQAATAAARSEANALIEEKLDQALAIVFEQERANLEALSLTDPTALKEYLTFEERIRSQYNRTINHARVKDFLEQVRARKTTYVAGQRSVLTGEIAAATSEKMLGDLMTFLSKLEPGNNDIVALQRQAEQRLAFVRQQRQQEEQARQMAESKRRQAAMKEARARAQAARAAEQRVAALRDQLRLKYGANLPTIEQLFYVKAYGAPIKGRVDDATKNKFINYVESMGYMMMNPKRELFSDSNRFKNRLGYQVSTSRIVGKNGESQFYAANLIITNAPRDLIELYHLELTNQYRPIDALRKQPLATTPTGDFMSKNYVESGGTLYSMQVEDGSLIVTAFDNLEAIFDVTAGESSPGVLEVTGFTDRTHLELSPGGKVTLKATGSIRLGLFAGNSGPAGVNGFRAYNVVSHLPHGALIGRFGKGDWFLVGNGGTFTAPQGGALRLIINDRDRGNNEGSYLVEY